MTKLRYTFGLSFTAALSFLLVFSCVAMEGGLSEEYEFKIGDYTKKYPVVSPKGNDNVKIVYISDFSDNIHLGEYAAQELASQIMSSNLLGSIEAIVIPGDKANMLGTLLWAAMKNRSDSSGIEFCILRSAEKSEPLHSVEYSSITGGNKKLHMRKDQAEKLKGKNVLIFDDVISTGGTLNAVEELIKKCGGNVVAFACVATEGEKRTVFNEKPLFSAVHLPVFENQNKD